jgi:hypothetical protein
MAELRCRYHTAEIERAMKMKEEFCDPAIAGARRVAGCLGERSPTLNPRIGGKVSINRKFFSVRVT